MNELRTIACAGILGLALASATPSAGENWLNNAELDFDVLEWDENSPSISELDWHTLDADACGDASGSALAQNFGIVVSTTAIFHQCVPGVVPGEEYTAGAYLRFPSGQAQSGHAYVRVRFMEQADCFGNTIGLPTASSNFDSTTTDAWAFRGVESVVAPVGANAAQVGVVLSKDSQTGVLDMHYDRVFFGPGSGYIFHDGFETDSRCRWSASEP
jgi:hypothetical protein